MPEDSSATRLAVEQSPLPGFVETLLATRSELLASRNDAGHWTGFLATSALSTATAVCALALQDPRRHRDAITRGLDWLASNAGADGGFGDTVLSKSNINTTALCYAAFGFAGTTGKDYSSTEARCAGWLRNACGGAIDPSTLARTILAFYGDDRTFSTPILTLLTLAGRLGERRLAFAHVPQLPFELAAFPRRWFKFLRLQVVSYALPALIAIGQDRHHHRPTRNPGMRLLRNLTRRRTLRLLEHIQPENGGYLEAIPLVSFVTANCSAMGLQDHRVVSRCVDFIYSLQRGDGGWPIDTNLATWATTLSCNALAVNHGLEEVLDTDRVVDWLLGQQFQKVHPFTDTPPGGFSWTDLPGAVPDADDTPGALLALAELAPSDPRVHRAATAAVRWLLGLQNADGGIPTFCKGWGALPFDQSAADISAHTLAAWARWHPLLPKRLRRRVDQAVPRVLSFLRRNRRPDGSWTPLWFGNEHAPDDINPCYGTARVLIALAKLGDAPADLIADGAGWLIANQQPSGAWSGCGEAEPSIEETALAVDALASVLLARAGGEGLSRRAAGSAIEGGIAWLIEHTELGQHFEPHPIGFYFAKLWYYESTYPVVFTLQALEKVARLWGVAVPITRDQLAAPTTTRD